MVAKFTFNPIQENTYVVYDESGECAIIDPGCFSAKEKSELQDFITKMNLKPVRLINTHCHIDHIPGNPFIASTYNLGLEIHKSEMQVLKSAPDYAEMFLGKQLEPMPEISNYLNEGDVICFGKTTLEILHTPGHSPGSISFYNRNEGYVISGDVLFYRSIGRYDLPGASGPVLFKSIEEKLMALPDSTTVYSGHGPETTIGSERVNNPFLK